MAPLPFIDAHAHLWRLDGRLGYAWLTPPFHEGGPGGSTEPIARDYLLPDYRAETALWNVQGLVHVDAADPADALLETQWLEAIAAAEGMPNAIVAFAPLHDPDVRSILAAQAVHPHVRGVRHTVNWHSDPARRFSVRDWTQDEQWRTGFGHLAEFGLSFDLQCYPGQMLTLAGLFDRHPQIPVIIDHLGMPIVTDPDGLGEWRRGLRALAAQSHVSIKLSGVGFAYRNWTLDHIRPLLLEAIDMFGTDRCMFASDFPVDRLFASFDDHLDAYHEVVADFSEAERRQLFGRTADRVYRLETGI